MDPQHFDAVLNAMLDREPFQVFTIEQYGGRLLEIDYRDALILQDGLAAFRAPGGVLLFFDHHSVRSIIDAIAADVPKS